LLKEFTVEQSFTRPPPRYTEASLVKELEKSGIGRPSTYATIMNKIQSREYTIKENSRLKPTELGQVIAQMLEANFQQIMNVGFTAMMEDDLERVAENQKDWKVLIREFWTQFNPTLEAALKEGFVPKVDTDIPCPTCHEGKLQKIWARSRYFYGCSRYPECSYSAPIEEISFNKEEYAADFEWEQKCPICQSEMKIRHGKYGTFLGCTQYPECKGIVNIPKKGELVIPMDDLPPCPAVDCPGRIVARKSRFGKTFYSCSTFPECDVIVNQLEQLSVKYAEHPRTPSAKKSKAKKTSKKPVSKSKKMIAKEKTTKTAVKKEKKPRSPGANYQLSTELATIVGVSALPRMQVTKKVWDYIKLHQLQDTTNKRLIRPDEPLSKVLGTTDPIDMFKLAGILNAHMKK
jgi:DNA topoisomerase-1